MDVKPKTQSRGIRVSEEIYTLEVVILPDVICLGELLIDFVSLDADTSMRDSTGFSKAPGGAPANVAAGVAKLGVGSGFIGKVGDDPFGAFLRGVLTDCGVDARYLITDERARTTLSFVAQKADGNRDCMFYRNPGADMLLSPDEIDNDYFKNASVFHFGSISFGCEPSKSATLTALDYAKQNGLLISYDPNLRLSLWDNEDHARQEINKGFKYADFVKISNEEYGFITGCSDDISCADYILKEGPLLVVITLGKDGCFYSDGTNSGYVKGYEVETIETTGAGDAFVAYVLAKLSNIRPHGRKALQTLIDSGNLPEVLRAANAAAAITTTKIGAIQSLPDACAVKEIMNPRTL